MYIREQHVALLPRIMTNSKFWHRRSKPACCPVAQTNDKCKNLAYTFKIYLLPCCPDLWQIQNFGKHSQELPVSQTYDDLNLLVYSIHIQKLLVALCPDPWQLRIVGIYIKKKASCPVAQTNYQFKILEYMFESCLLPCCTGQWRLQNFDLWQNQEICIHN